MSATELAIHPNQDPYTYRPMPFPRHRESSQKVSFTKAPRARLIKLIGNARRRQAEAEQQHGELRKSFELLNSARYLEIQELLEDRTWLPEALTELATIDEEIKEDNLPQIGSAARSEAKRILNDLRYQTIAPTIYPTKDGEIAIHFRSPVASEAVIIEINDDLQGACFAYTNGKSRRARFEDSTEMPDEFVKAQLEALKKTSSAK